MKRMLLTTSLLAFVGLVGAKLPAPTLDDAAKAKAAEAAAKTAWQAKADAYLLCKAQDRVAAQYMKASGKAVPVAAKAGKEGKAAKVGKDKAAATAAAAPAPAAAASGTPAATVAAAAPPPPCMDPGPFAYNPPEQKPLETSGAHSPTGTAASPPSVKKPSAEMAPAKKKKA